MINLPPRVDPSGLARVEMLYNSWVVIAHMNFIVIIGPMMVWECYYCMLMPIPCLNKVWVTVVWHASASNDQSPPSSLTLRFARAEMMPSNSWVVLAHIDWAIGAVMVWQCYPVVPTPITSLKQVCVTVVWLASVYNDQSPPKALIPQVWLELKCCQILEWF